MEIAGDGSHGGKNHEQEEENCVRSHRSVCLVRYLQKEKGASQPGMVGIAAVSAVESITNSKRRLTKAEVAL